MFPIFPVFETIIKELLSYSMNCKKNSRPLVVIIFFIIIYPGAMETTLDISHQGLTSVPSEVETRNIIVKFVYFKFDLLLEFIGDS